ncbi:hypothetical protein H632_c5458p0, partial [Helicosporidium sp. ATCC 50920]
GGQDGRGGVRAGAGDSQLHAGGLHRADQGHFQPKVPRFGRRLRGRAAHRGRADPARGAVPDHDHRDIAIHALPRRRRGARRGVGRLRRGALRQRRRKGRGMGGGHHSAAAPRQAPLPLRHRAKRHGVCRVGRTHQAPHGTGHRHAEAARAPRTPPLLRAPLLPPRRRRGLPPRGLPRRQGAR